MAVNDIYQVRVLQEYLDEECVNVFYYRVTSGSANTAEDLYAEFTDVVWDAVRALQSDWVTTHRFEIINGNNNLDFWYQDVSSLGGYGTGLNMGAQIAYGFRSPSGGPGSRYSYKRFAGVNSGVLDTGSFGRISEAIMEGLGRNIAIALGTALEGASASYAPTQVTGGFQLGVAPVSSQDLEGQWSMNSKFATQRTRSQYAWQVAPAP